VKLGSIYSTATSCRSFSGDVGPWVAAVPSLLVVEAYWNQGHSRTESSQKAGFCSPPSPVQTKLDGCRRSSGLAVVEEKSRMTALDRSRPLAMVASKYRTWCCNCNNCKTFFGGDDDDDV
jgi:hypothetical protein